MLRSLYLIETTPISNSYLERFIIMWTLNTKDIFNFIPVKNNSLFLNDYCWEVYFLLKISNSINWIREDPQDIVLEIPWHVTIFFYQYFYRYHIKPSVTLNIIIIIWWVVLNIYKMHRDCFFFQTKESNKIRYCFLLMTTFYDRYAL